MSGNSSGITQRSQLLERMLERYGMPLDQKATEQQVREMVHG